MSAIIMELGNLVFNYETQRHNVTEEEKLRENLLKIIEENEMNPLYLTFIEKYGWVKNDTLSESLR